MRTSNGPSATRWAFLCSIMILVLGWAIPWPTAQAAPAFQSVAPNNATTATLTITKPTGVVQNDLLIATLAARGNTTITAPAGWTLVQRTNNGTTQTLAVFYRVATATDIAATDYAFTLGASVGVAGAILRYTGADPRFPIDVSGIATGTSANATAPAVTTTVADTTVVRVAGIPNNGALTVPTGTDSRVNTRRNDGANSTRLGVADAAQAAAGATGTAAFTNTSGAWVAATLAIRPYTGEICANPPGSGTTTLPAGVYNTYYPGTATANAGAVSLTLGASRGAATPIAVGDLLLVMQMQDAAINTTNTGSYGDGVAGDPATGASNYNNAGKYEFVVAKSAVGTGGGTVQIEGKGAGGGLINTYTNANATTTQGQRRFQVVRVPQLYDATVTGAVTAAAWDGTSGGIVALDVANTLTFSGGSINVNAQGFRGGGGQGLTGGGGANTDYRTRVTVNTNGNKAEGVAGSPNFMYDGTTTLATGSGYPDGANTDASRARGAPGNAGGGGTDGNPAANDQNSGGGGGGNGGAGGLGGNTWSSNLPRGGFGGAVFPHATDRLALGGGGGSGSRNNSANVQSSGGRGGGLILIRANAITGTATLSANGGVGVTPANDGGGGGGAGGSVLVYTRTGTLTGLTITANGGNGTNADPTGSAHGPGGGGAGGVVYLSSSAGSTSVAGGANGTTTTALNPYGATPGSAGAVSTALTAAGIPGVISGATCKATLASVVAFEATVESGRVVLNWETSFELGTAGFQVERLEPISGDYERLNDSLLPALITSPQGGRYSLVDPDAWPDQTYTYRLVEQEVWGSVRVHGPYTVTPVVPARQMARTALVSQPQVANSNPGYDEPARGYRATPHPMAGRNVARGARTVTPLASNKPTGAAQIPVRQNGLYYLSVAEIAKAPGNTVTNVQKWLSNRRLNLTMAGKNVAWLPAAKEAGILFYGEAIDSLYTRDNIYRLRTAQGVVMDQVSDSGPPAAAAGAFSDTVTIEQDKFAATVVSTCTECDYWYWEGFIGAVANWDSKRFAIRLPDVVEGGRLAVFLKGAAAGSHPVQVSVNGQLLGQGMWNDLADYELRLPVTAAQLQSGDNLVEVRALGGSENMFYLDRIEVNYRRLARAANDQISLKAERDGPLGVDGFSTTDIHVFDISNPIKPVHITGVTVTPGAMGQSVTFTAEKGRHYLVLSGKAILPAEPVPMTAADLQTSRDQVDYLVIAPPALRDAAQTLADYRQGQGLNARVVSTDEIYDSYNWGIPSPHAVRDFLRQAAGSWGVRYVVLAGIGSFDYRDLSDKGEPQAPTLLTTTPNGLFGCDNCLADFDGDGAPDLAIGRIPAASAADLEIYLAKIKAYEQGTLSLHQAGALLLADKRDPKAGDFARDSESLATLLPPGMNVKPLYLDQYAIADARALLFPAMNQGVGWVNYIGHGGMDRFGGAPGLLTSDDMGALNSTGQLPVVSAPTCTVNRFETPGYAALGERLILDADGGAIAVWSATGLSLNDPAVTIDRSLFAAVFQQWTPTLGEAVRQAIQDNRQRRDVPAYMLRIYSLLGDPALKLRY